ncbi:MAG TPA: type I phosphomannose isomerase catalytic subunit [Opitutaceae bacterium]|nr:type I phosphomannose isomerase catalytic subunit [Opitutaceae bacterium]
MQNLLRLKPLYQERVWGGRALESALNRALPGTGPIGESWEIVDRPEAQSIVLSRNGGNQTLREVIAKNAAEIMGPGWPKDRAFPILVKWLDCKERLSLQVHPPARVAGELKGEPKTENWYIAATAPGSHLIVGLKQGATREKFEKALHELTLENCVHRFPVNVGDSILVHSGQIHAIDGGNLILEIQQNSDTTYRVYDWGRVGLDGKPRQMHVNQSLRSIDWNDFEPQLVRAERRPAVIADAAEFRIRRVPLAANETLKFAANEQVRILSVVNGTIRDANAGETLTKGDNVILPYSGEFSFKADDAAMLLITENFS